MKQKEKIFQGIAQGRKKALENWFNDIWFAMESTRDTILAYLQDNELNLSEMNEILEDKKNQFKDYPMSYLKCAICNHKQSLPVNKHRLIGVGISAFGALGWFSFLFAGSGHAFFNKRLYLFIWHLFICYCEKMGKRCNFRTKMS